MFQANDGNEKNRKHTKQRTKGNELPVSSEGETGRHGRGTQTGLSEGEQTVSDPDDSTSRSQSVQKNAAAHLPVFVHAMGYNVQQGADARTSLLHPLLLFTVRGLGQVTVDGRTTDLAAGAGFYLNRGVAFSLQPKEAKKPWIVNWVSLAFGIEEAREMLFLPLPFQVAPSKGQGRLEGLFRDIHTALNSDAAYGTIRASGELYRLVIEVNRQMMDIPETTEKGARIVNRAAEYINERYREEISLPLLCTAAGGVSEQYLCRLFRQYLGVRPIEYLLKKRIAEARILLEKSDMPISEIAGQVGFRSTSYFYRNFKKFTGLSPLGYRQMALGIRGLE